MLVCVLLVAALAGQPAWGDGQTGQPSPGRAQAAAASANGAPNAGDRSGTSQSAQNTTIRKARKKASKSKARKSRGSKSKAKKSKAKKSKAKKSRAKKKASNRQEDVPPPPPETQPPPDLPDPTPPAEGDPPPVDIGEAPAAPPEAGADAPVDAPIPEVPPEPAQTQTATPEEPPAPVTDEPAPNVVGKVSAEPETATPTSLENKTTDPPATQPSIGPATSGDPGPGASPTGNDGTDPNNAAGGPLNGGTAPGALPGAAPGTPANPIVAGTTLSLPARDLVAPRPGTETSRAPGRGASGIGSLQPPSSLGLNYVAGLVKDIPAWIKLALAGLALLVLLLGAYTVLAAARTRRLERQRSKLMEDIGLLQAALLPAVPGRLGALLTTVAYRPADGPAAGGDFYDAFALSDGRVGLLLGDISGHGRQALAKTTLVRFTVRAHLEAGMSPREALAISGRSLDGRLADDFSTVIAAIHDPVKGTLTYASAGHPPPLVVGPQAHEPVTASSAPPIGAGFPTGQRQTVLPMPEGTTVCVYSDGLLEARIEGDALGRQRLETWLRELGSDATAKALLDLVVQRADRVPDDLAACVLHAASGATAPATRVEQLKLDVLDVEGPELEGFLKACGVSRADRAIAGRRVSEQLAVSGGVVVEVRIGEHPMVSVASIGDHAAGGSRPASRVR
jgi:hypothetical protein